MRIMLLATVLATTLAAVPQAPKPSSTPTYTKIYALKPREGVFAYARISPDGQKLVYASQLPAHPASPVIGPRRRRSRDRTCSSTSPASMRGGRPTARRLSIRATAA